MSLILSQIAVDARDPEALAKWWSEVLGWPTRVDSDGDAFVTPPPGQGTELLFLAVPDAKVVKNRVHLDFTPEDQAAEVERLIGLGATRVDIGQGEQSWVVLADPEGNEFCIL
ncbi:VOC family protein [Mycobacterium sp. C31M]